MLRRFGQAVGSGTATTPPFGLSSLGEIDHCPWCAANRGLRRVNFNMPEPPLAPCANRRAYRKPDGTKGRAEAASRFGHVESDPMRTLIGCAPRLVAALTKRREPEGLSRRGDPKRLATEAKPLPPKSKSKFIGRVL